VATQILVVSAAAAISDVGLNAADRRLDSEHYPCVHPMAFAHTWASMGGASRLGHAAGIRMRRDRCCDYRSAPKPAVGHSSMLNGVDGAKDSAPRIIIVSGILTPSSHTASVQLTRGAIL
jgi:hypothetical protein